MELRVKEHCDPNALSQLQTAMAKVRLLDSWFARMCHALTPVCSFVSVTRLPSTSVNCVSTPPLRARAEPSTVFSLVDVLDGTQPHAITVGHSTASCTITVTVTHAAHSHSSSSAHMISLSNAARKDNGDRCMQGDALAAYKFWTSTEYALHAPHSYTSSQHTWEQLISKPATNRSLAHLPDTATTNDTSS